MSVGTKIVVTISRQILQLHNAAGIVREYAISTAKNGLGELSASGCTPRGHHIIRAKIGAGCVANTVFISRRATGEIFSQALADAYPGRDWILTRILWLSGCELGKNRLGSVDTMRRYIYVHGCPDDTIMGIPASHGCIRMKNKDIVELFDLVVAGTAVTIAD